VYNDNRSEDVKRKEFNKIVKEAGEGRKTTGCVYQK
jgi:hypothetical protein